MVRSKNHQEMITIVTTFKFANLTLREILIGSKLQPPVAKPQQGTGTLCLCTFGISELQTWMPASFLRQTGRSWMVAFPHAIAFKQCYGAIGCLSKFQRNLHAGHHSCGVIELVPICLHKQDVVSWPDFQAKALPIIIIIITISCCNMYSIMISLQTSTSVLSFILPPSAIKVTIRLEVQEG